LAIIFLIVFIAGIGAGIFLVVCWASNREDRKKSIKDPPSGNGTGGARHLTGVGRRDVAVDWPYESPGPRPGQRRGRDG
jgi:hypothetical protein